ncbi:MAG TPA: hypothetical protein PLQ13_08255 [Candidatus Krumholzibacteria bacterium]|nr:hypothetical protein [Candidatus Krumholzibacteria bacterium]
MSGLSRKDALLLLAGVRVLTHKLERPPTPEQVADLLDLPESAVRLQLTQLADLGAVALVTSAFETHAEVRDHLAVEQLPEVAGPAIAEDLEAFDRRKREERDRMANLFDSGEHDQHQQDKLRRMDDDLQAFRRKKNPNPFGDD